METNQMKAINISTKQAINSLLETNLIRVLKEGEVPGLVVRYLPREEVKKLISENQVQITGPEAIKKSFGMSLKDEAAGVVFIETRTE